jgi:cathepsin L
MLFFVLAFLAAAVTAEVTSADHALFKSWMVKHTKVYQSAEETQYRLSVFADNAKFVRNFDSKARGFTVALNEFSDLTGQEFKAIFNGMNISKVPGPFTPADVSDTDATVDWRKKGAVTPVKNQGQCGSCWSFSTTGSTEGAWFLAKGKLVSLSEQNLVDCSTAQGNQGCNGGLMDQAFQYIISNNGIDTEASYPYTATGPNQCQFNANNVGATLSSFTDVTSGDENALQRAVNLAPVSVAIDASQQSFQLYNGGVYNEPACSSTQLDHGVLAVGYGVDNASGSAYWIVKNSWGASWGLQGYILMSRNLNNQCGIATAASYPKV